MPLDFSGQNLQGRNFKSQDLTGANFSYADIRGTNFTNTILREANFSHAKAGLQPRQAILLVLVLFVAIAAVAFSFGLAGLFVIAILQFNNVKVYLIAGCLIFICSALFLAVTVKRLYAVAKQVWKTKDKYRKEENIIVNSSFTASIVSAFIFFICLINIMYGYYALVVTFTVVGGFSALLAVLLAVAVAGADTVAGPLAVVTALTGIVTLAGAITSILVSNGIVDLTLAINLVATVATFVALLSIYIGSRALKEDPKFLWIRMIAVNFAATGGTSFRGSDLTNAIFMGTILKNTDFREANLTHTCFFNAKNIEQSRQESIELSILANPSVRKLLVTGNGHNQSYINANLKGANLSGYDLGYANLKEANITHATFQGANLEWANLTLTQAINTDFTSAQMTGACVEGWNIESNTKLDNVDCRFVYLLEYPKPGTDDRERRPSSGEFKPGEFTKLFEEVLTTVDLIFDKGIDWKAFIAAFKKVQVENEDTELVIQSIENKGDGVIVVRVSVPPDANKEKIHSDFTQNYALALKAVEEKYKADLQAKDREIQIYREKSVDLKEIIGLLATRQININNEAIATSESKSMSESNEYNLQDAKITGSNVGTNYGTQVGTQHNYAAQQNLAEAAKDIQQLLQQLSESNPTNTPSEKMVVVEKAIKQIEADPTLRERVIGAVKSGGIEAFKELIDHPLVNILVAVLEGWQVGD